MVETFGTSRLSRERLTQLIRKHFDLTPYGPARDARSGATIYQKTATYGHFAAPSRSSLGAHRSRQTLAAEPGRARQLKGK